ncbi:RecX family transcriptional regulator [Sphingobium sp. AN558]|uniref:regulatory protein RecX n=1 Tax=Sphingobium sp. AN558 TaxID=3133442 RepID=UPI0030BE8205
MSRKAPRPPLNDESLRELALHYVGRFATSRARLLAYLERKLRERGWSGENPAAPDALVERLGELRYVDDAAYATMKSGALARRGFGPRRVEQALREAGIEAADRVAATTPDDAAAWEAANRFARRKRLGPYATQTPDPAQHQKAIAAFLRAGHDFATARRWLDAPPGIPPERPDNEG